MSIKNPKSPKPVPPGFKQGSKHKSSIPSHSLIKGQQPPESPLIKGELKGVKRHLLSILLIAIIGVAIYSNTLSSAFVFDDMRNIVDNYKIRDLSNFYDLSGTRYIGFLSFALNYHFGGLNVFGYHIVNIIIHIINGLLVYYLILLTFKTPVMERTTTKIQDARFKMQDSKIIALMVSLIFVSHPIQTQAVAYIVQRFTSLCTLFYLLSLVLYVKARLLYSKQYAVGSRQSGFTSYYLLPIIIYLVSLFSAILAMKTKEISWTLPFIVLLYEFMFLSPFSFQPFGKLRAGFSAFSYLIPLLLTIIIIPLSLIGADKPIGDIIGEIREKAQETEEIARNVYLLTQFRVIGTYIRLLFLPVHQNLDYDYPLHHAFFESEVFLSFLFLLSILISAIYLYIQSRKKGNGYGLLISFGIFFFFITLSVESSVIPIRDVIFEHRLYLPSVGFMIVLLVGLFWLFEYLRKAHDSWLMVHFIGLIFLIAAAAGIATYQRNKVWRDEISLWMDVISKSPDKTRGHINLGVVYDKQGHINEAIKEYKLTLTLKPDNADAHYNLGVVYEKQGQYDDAIKEYKLALTLKSNYDMAHNNLGATYEKQGQYDDAIKEYKLVLNINSDNAEAHNNLGNAYNKQGRLDEAIKEYLDALRLKPDIAEVHNNLGSIYHKQGRLDEAIKKYLDALRLKPDIAEAHNNLGSIYHKQGRLDEAIKEYLDALRLKPNIAMVHNNLGFVYIKQNKLNEAIDKFLTALKLDPNDPITHYNMALAYNLKGLNDRAIKELETVLRLKPDYTPARELLESIRRR